MMPLEDANHVFASRCLGSLCFLYLLCPVPVTSSKKVEQASNYSGMLVIEKVLNIYNLF